jgi:hypothetical protein
MGKLSLCTGGNHAASESRIFGFPYAHIPIRFEHQQSAAFPKYPRRFLDHPGDIRNEGTNLDGHDEIECFVSAQQASRHRNVCQQEYLRTANMDLAQVRGENGSTVSIVRNGVGR